MRGSTAARAAPVLPWFAVVFALLVIVTSLGWIPAPLIDAGSVVSRWCLVTAIAAIGIKTSLKSLVDMGMKPVVLMVLEAVFLAALVCGGARVEVKETAAPDGVHPGSQWPGPGEHSSVAVWRGDETVTSSNSSAGARADVLTSETIFNAT